MSKPKTESRIKALESARAGKKEAAEAQRRLLTLRRVDYRAGITPGIEEAPGSIPVRWVDYSDQFIATS